MPVIFLGKADPQLSKLETSSDGLGPACEVKIGRLLDISLVFLRVLNIISPVVFLYIPILGDIKHRLKWCLDHCSFPMKRWSNRKDCYFRRSPWRRKILLRRTKRSLDHGYSWIIGAAGVGSECAVALSHWVAFTGFGLEVGWVFGPFWRCAA